MGVLEGPPNNNDATWFLDTGPMRVRIVGNIDDLGYEEGWFNPQLGIDLFWEGHRWTSVVFQAIPNSIVRFFVVRLDQSDHHPGLMQGGHRINVHDSRHFNWGPEQTVKIP